LRFGEPGGRSRRRTQFDQRLVNRQLEIGRGADPDDGQPGVQQMATKRVLPGPMLRRLSPRRQMVGVLADQEDEPRLAALAGGIKLQLGVGHIGTIAHRRPVAESVHVGLRDHLRADGGRRGVAGGEVGHVGTQPAAVGLPGSVRIPNPAMSPAMA
jgi:hypothetical protein